MDYLDQCPFCGSANIGVELRFDGLYIRDPDRRDPRRYIAYSAVCNRCGAQAPMVKVNESTYNARERYLAVERAADLWNGDAVV